MKNQFEIDSNQFQITVDMKITSCFCIPFAFFAKS